MRLLKTTIPTEYIIAVGKKAATSRASTIALVADPELTVPVHKGEVWQIRAFVAFDLDATGGLQMSLSAPAGSTGGTQCVDIVSGANGSQTPPDGTTAILTIDTETRAMLDLGAVITVGANGNIAFVWGQKVSNVGPAIALIGSSITARRIS